MGCSPAKAEADALESAEEAAMTAALAMPATSGYNFEGSRIENYLGFVSAEVVLGMGFFRGIGVDCSRFYGHGFRRRVRECFYSLVRILQVSSIRAWSGA